VEPKIVLNQPGDDLRFGVYLPSYVIPGNSAPTVDFLQNFSRRAEDVGFDSLWVIDHLFDAFPSYRVVYMEPITSLALVAGATRRIRLGTGILILPLRDPVVTAKSLANLDVTTGGRLIFGVGVGWDEKEFAACQIDKSTRGRRMDEMLDIIKGLWTNDAFSYRGTFFEISDVTLTPKPLQNPHPPILIAAGLVPTGSSQHITTAKGYTPNRSFARVGRIGDGLMTAYRSAPGLDMSCLTASWDRVCIAARDHGRDPATLQFAHQDHLYIDLNPTPSRLRDVFEKFTHNDFEHVAPIYLMGHPQDLIPRIQARIDAGVQELTFNLLSPDPQQLNLFMDEIRPHLVPRSQNH
jgi:probable F420-dependent oxidoreductase